MNPYSWRNAIAATRDPWFGFSVDERTKRGDFLYLAMPGWRALRWVGLSDYCESSELLSRCLKHIPND